MGADVVDVFELPLASFLRKHAPHGKGPWRDVDVGMYARYTCTCGALYAFPLADVDVSWFSPTRRLP